MEKKKNNAIEKVNNAIENAGGTPEKEVPDKRDAIKKNDERRRKRTALKKQKERERNERVKLRKNAAKEMIKAEMKAAKLRGKEERKLLKIKNKQKNRENGRAFGGYLASTIALGAVAVVLAGVLTYTLIIPTANDNALENAYRRSFYNTVAEINNIDNNLSKAIVSSDKGAMITYLSDTAINSELAESDIQDLPLKDDSKFNTTKIVNQTGDFSKYLLKKLAEGESVSENDLVGLKQLYKANAELKKALAEIRENIGGDYSFTSLLNAGKGDKIISGLNGLENLSVSYPELIYDGPFSDGKEERKVKGLNYPEISRNEAEEIFNKIFSEYELKEVVFAGENKASIECYNFSAQSKGNNLYASITKKGGKLLSFSYAGDCKQVKYYEDYAESKALEFLSKTGIADVKPVWINLSDDNVYTINIAGEKNGVILYPDLIKVRVCAYSGEVIGVEASGYYTNHTERVIKPTQLSEEAAAKKVNSSIAIKNGRLAIVPIGEEKEVLSYEFMGEYDGSTYYVYIDANTGKEVQMFKVIETTEGTLLI